MVLRLIRAGHLQLLGNTPSHALDRVESVSHKSEGGSALQLQVNDELGV